MAASPSFSDDPFAIGSVLDDRYRIEAVLGTGGMGRVYRAEHTKIGKSVAIKVLHADLTRNREASQRFQREAIASGRLDHPNIVGVSDFGVLDTGACYLVMEVLEGESLGDRLSRDRRIHWVEALDILRGVLYGLRHAHERGVVHRDIKPDNVYLAHKDGELVIKILDFGIAKLYAGSEDDPASTRAGLTVGTPAYLSPEQAVGGEITPASDLYSASIVLYEMLAGRAPFEDKDPLAMLGAHVSRPPPRFGDVAPGVEIPAALEDIVQRGLRKAPAERIATATDYLGLIDAFSPPLHPMPRLASTPIGVPIAAQIDPASGAMASVAVAVRTAAAATPIAGAPVATTSLPGSSLALATPRPAPPPAGQVSGEIAPLPRATRAVSLADVSEPIPLTWIIRSGVVIGLVIVAAIALAIGAHCQGTRAAQHGASGAGPSGGPGGASGRSPGESPAPADRPRDTVQRATPDPDAQRGERGDPARPAAAEPASGPARPAPAGRPAGAAAKPAPLPGKAAGGRPGAPGTGSARKSAGR